MRNRKLFITLGITLVLIVLLVIFLYPHSKPSFYDYDNKFNNNAIGDASIIFDDIDKDATKYTSDNKVNTVIKQVETNYGYTFKHIEDEFMDTLTNIYVRSCVFENIDGVQYIVFINTLSDGTVIAQLE